MRMRGWVGASGAHMFHIARQHNERQQQQQRFTQRPRCLCGNAINDRNKTACNRCWDTLTPELVLEFRNSRGAQEDRRIAAEAAIENFLRCERAQTNQPQESK